MKNVLKDAIRLADSDPRAVPRYLLVPGVRGVTTGKVQILLNILAARLPDNEAYLEIGILEGGTLLGALIDNFKVHAYACDKFAHKGSREKFKENVSRHKSRLPKFTFFDTDCFELARRKRPFAFPIGVYFYDGDHSAEATRRGLVEFKRFFAKEVIIIIDDWNWDQVRKGGLEGIRELKPRTVCDLSILTDPSFVSTPLNYKYFFNGLGLFWLDW
jgi:hypothetical protein